MLNDVPRVTQEVSGGPSRIRFPDSRSSALTTAPTVLSHWVFAMLTSPGASRGSFVPESRVSSKDSRFLGTISLCLVPPLSLRLSLLLNFCSSMKEVQSA